MFLLALLLLLSDHDSVISNIYIYTTLIVILTHTLNLATTSVAINILTRFDVKMEPVRQLIENLTGFMSAKGHNMRGFHRNISLKYFLHQIVIFESQTNLPERKTLSNVFCVKMLV